MQGFSRWEQKKLKKMCVSIVYTALGEWVTDKSLCFDLPPLDKSFVKKVLLLFLYRPP